jgi:hypothetical protein
LYSGLDAAELLDVGREDLELTVAVLLPDCDAPVTCDLREAEVVPLYDRVAAEYDLEPSDRLPDLREEAVAGLIALLYDDE